MPFEVMVLFWLGNEAASRWGHIKNWVKVIEVDIGDYVPIPPRPQSVSLVSLFIAEFTIFSIFSGPKLPK